MLLEVNHLVKSFEAGSGTIHALKDLSFQMEKGQSICIIGNNGSGKSTFLKIVAGIYRQNSGKINFKGQPLFHDDISAKSLIGYQPEDVKLPDLITIDEYVEFIIGLKGPYLQSTLDFNVEKNELYDLFDLHDKKQLYFNEASLGNRKKAALSGALICSPELIIIDEPTNGLDLRTQTRLFEYINTRLEKGASVLAATHSPDYIEKTGTHKGICLVKGEATICNSKEEIFEKVTELKSTTYS